MFRIFVPLSNGRVWEGVFDTPGEVDAFVNDFSVKVTGPTTVTEVTPDHVHDDAPESRGFHDPEDHDAGGCSWITPQGSY
jgi:hypothetical protein